MPEYNITFCGRRKGAIGIFYTIFVVVDAENEEEAILRLYENYEHISVYAKILERKEEKYYGKT